MSDEANVEVGTIIAAVVLVLSMQAVAHGQSDGRFSGVVLDPSGAVVAGATVVVKNERTGAERSVVTDAGGRYIVTGLAPSSYTITVKAGNFAPLEYTGVAAGGRAGVLPRPEPAGRGRAARR